MSAVTCPVCGSDEFKRTYSTEKISFPWGPEVSYESACCACPLCKHDGDFYLENDAKVTNALAVSRQQAAVAMIENLQQRNVPLSYVERVLRMPQGTVKMWKQRCTPEGAALLMMLVVDGIDVLARLDGLAEANKR